MTTFEIISLVLNFVFGGACIVTLATLKATRAKANEAAKSARLDNSQKILELNREFIVEPLTEKMNGLEKTVKKLERAISKISSCNYSANCPVRHELHSEKNNNKQ